MGLFKKKKKEFKEEAVSEEDRKEMVRDFQKFNYGVAISDTDTGEMLHFTAFERLPTHYEILDLLKELQSDPACWPDIKGHRFHITMGTMEMINLLKNGDLTSLMAIKVFYQPDEGGHLHVHRG